MRGVHERFAGVELLASLTVLLLVYIFGLLIVMYSHDLQKYI